MRTSLRPAELLSIAATLLLCVSMRSADAGSVSSFTLTGTTSTQNVAGTATFTINNGLLTVDLSNNVVDPRSAATLLGGISFSIGGGGALSNLVASGNLVSISSTGIIGTPSAAETAAALSDWTATGTGTYSLRDYGNDGLIVGSPDSTGVYNNANNSLTNGSHDPYFSRTAQFTMNIAGLTSTSSISNVSFLWGTNYVTATNATLVSSTSSYNVSGAAVPLPSAAASGLSLVLGLAGMQYFRRKPA